MPRIRNDQERRVLKLRKQLETAGNLTDADFTRVIEHVEILIPGISFCLYSPVDRGDHIGIQFRSTSAALPSALMAAAGRFAEQQNLVLGGRSPLRPAARLRNRAMTFSELIADPTDSRAQLANIFRSHGFWPFDQLRALICDGPSMLDWVGGFRSTPFTVRERRPLQSLVPSFQRRLVHERRVGNATITESALIASLAALGAPAFVVSAKGAVLYANRSAHAILDRDRPGMSAAIRESLKGRPTRPGFSITRLDSTGRATHYLAIMDSAPADPAPRVARAINLWRLTPREAEVLGYLAHGVPNKTIADALGCAESTIEVHVTRLIAKAHAENRTALVAMFWTAL